MLQRHHYLLITCASLAALSTGVILFAEHAAALRALLAVPSSQSASAGRHGASSHHPRIRPRPRVRGEGGRMAGGTASPSGSLVRHAPLYLGLFGWAGLLVLAISTASTADRRLRNRIRRDYRRYEVKLSMHDDAKPGDVEDLVEALGAAVRKRYNDRVTDGQPFIALELWHRPSHAGMQWALCMVCEAHMTRTLEGIIASAYPDVRVGRAFDEEPEPCPWPLVEPGHVMRFRKRRPFVHPLGHPSPADGQGRGRAAPLIEAIAMAQVAVGAPSLVRLQLLPASEQREDRARRRLERYERRHAARRHPYHHPMSGSALAQAELRSAVEVRHRSMFYLEIQVGSTDWETCNRIAASVVARRGENHLHRRDTVLRQRLYRRRFPSAYPPLLPPLSLRTLVSGGELAHLIELPSARMKGVPVRRLTIPRMPAPPGAFRATELEPPAAPRPLAARDTAVKLRRDGAVAGTSG